MDDFVITYRISALLEEEKARIACPRKDHRDVIGAR